jgi:hypothetical protein
VRREQMQRAFRDDAGRVHLVVHRDPTSGTDRLELSAPLFEEDWQDQVAASTATTALGVLGRSPTLAGILELTRRAMSSMERLVAGLLSQAPAGAVACKAGCDHCCHVVVALTAPEALTIFDHLVRTLSDAARRELRTRLAELHERTRGLTSSERFSPEFPCAFLEGGRCSIYEVRPFACRGMNSLDAAECETRLRDPVARKEFTSHGGGHLFLEPVRAFHAISAGLQLGLSELYRLDMRPLELSAAMLALLEHEGAVAEAWLAGGRPFDTALAVPTPRS